MNCPRCFTRIHSNRLSMTFYLQSCQKCGFNISPYREMTKAISNYPTAKNYLLRAKWFYESGRRFLSEDKSDQDLQSSENHGYLSAINDLKKAISCNESDSFEKDAIEESRIYLDQILAEANEKK